jgi:hypothetical protein
MTTELHKTFVVEEDERGREKEREEEKVDLK